MYLNVQKHICPVDKFNTFQEIPFIDIVQNMSQYGKVCDACHVHFPVCKNIHPMRRFKGVDLCWDCYNVSEIRQETNTLLTYLLMDDIRKGNTSCDLCHARLIDVDTQQRIRGFERDHIDPSTKCESVGKMVMMGCTLESILEENSKCRLLCIPCHSIVTYLEKHSGAENKVIKMLPYFTETVVPFIRKLSERIVQTTN